MASNQTIPFSPPYIDQEVIDEVVSTLNSGWITTGPKVKCLEQKVAEYSGVEYAVCVNSATSGLILLLRWMGVGKGDEVIVPSYTYCATALAVLHVGAKPIMVDVSKDFNINVKEIRQAITNKTKVIVPVDFGGWPCDYDAIHSLITEKEILQLFNPSNEIQGTLGRIAVVSDAAHSFGARSGKAMVGKLTDATVFSFHAVKNLTTAEGGAVCLNFPKEFDGQLIYKQLKLLSLNGQTKDAFAKSQAGGWRYDIVTLGMKMNMPDICAAIGLAQISNYNDKILNGRKKVFELYSENLAKYPWAILPEGCNSEKESSYHLYALRIKGIDERRRDRMIELITSSGISVNVHFIPLPMLSLFKEMGYNIVDYPVAYENYATEISLPIYPQLKSEQVEFIVSSVAEAFNNSK